MPLKPPILIINFKAYENAVGKGAVELSKAADEVGREFDVSAVVCPQPTDIFRIAEVVDIPVFAQHVDFVEPGKFTGHVLIEAVKAAGAVGTLINHSERRLPMLQIDRIVKRAKGLKLDCCVCAGNASTSAAVAALGPDYVAFEDPRLIGTGVSVSTAKPEAVRESVKRILDANPRVVPLCGAGITDGTDAYRALELGAEGVLVASGIVKAKDPKEALIDIASGLRRAAH
ncbi:MAG: triose-phosphate isomerase [Candidatus Bathyarchaeia archaeon]